ncbi:hypothetical protein N9897_00645 [bacterium]|nr:hypothetical protein [Akkermansiaceae bacterium]MDB4274526.1 hypothetical protein [Akkermansiaceae bacterium]MDB4284728.1 hypothetical protein [bacterium]MDB4570045.1 hypothetical protein [Akkermansiaceae bacterium]
MTLRVESSDEHPIGSLLTEVTLTTLQNLSTKEAAYSFKLKLNKKWSLAQVSVTYQEKTISVSDLELPDLKLVDLRQAYVKTERKATSYKDPGTSVILIIPFEQELRPDPQSKEKGDTVRVSNVIRLLFYKGDFQRWEMATSLGEESGAWSLSFKDKGEPVADNGKEVELNNPYWTRSPMNYSTSWSKER